MSEDMSEEMKLYAANDWEVARRQNEKLSVSPYAGFTVATKGIEFQDDLSEKMVDLMVQIGEDEISVADVMKKWYAYDNGLMDLLTVNTIYNEDGTVAVEAFADYKAYHEVTGNSLDDYLAFFKSAVIMQEFELQADYKSDDMNKYNYKYDATTGERIPIAARDRIYEIVMGSHTNNPLSQYTEFFASKRDTEGSFNLFK
jgi:hypothetical protein